MNAWKVRETLQKGRKQSWAERPKMAVVRSTGERLITQVVGKNIPRRGLNSWRPRRNIAVAGHHVLCLALTWTLLSLSAYFFAAEVTSNAQPSSRSSLLSANKQVNMSAAAKILVYGGRGALGSSIVRHLKSKNCVRQFFGPFVLLLHTDVCFFFLLSGLEALI